MQIRPKVPGLERSFVSAPTVDPERNTPFRVARNWTPNHIEIFGHNIEIDIPTGNLVISSSDVSYPYHDFSLGISRKYDGQEQQMQLSYLRNYPNVNPKPHWFGNWQSEYEGAVDEVWSTAYPEIHLTSDIGANGLFEISGQDFKRNQHSGATVQDILKKYGIPGRSLLELGWVFAENDFLLRTHRGVFQILAGHFREETFVDDIEAQLWLFNPISGLGYKLTSDYFYNIASEHYRDVGYALVVAKITDALGHAITLKPSVPAPPYRSYTLSDGSGRQFEITLDQEFTFLDGLKAGRKVRKFLASKVTDRTRAGNQYQYKYTPGGLLEEVLFPSSLGNMHVRYLYDSVEFLGVITAIQNHEGERVSFDYLEDPRDNDDRLNPRLKIRKITDPEGIAFEYEYSHDRSQVVVTVSRNGIVDRKVRYEYMQDQRNTKQRYITLAETEVRRGFILDRAGVVNPIAVHTPQVIRNRTEYSTDGKFNIERQIDPLGRTVRFEYNEYNQIEQQWDVDNHWTQYTYDIPSNPSATNPTRYDLLQTEQENLVRSVNAANQIVEAVKNVVTKYQYKKYDANTSTDPSDLNALGGFSTHRVEKMIDQRQKVWTYAYDDVNNFNPLAPTSITSPLGNKTAKSYNDHGEIIRFIDAELNVHSYSYYPQGVLKDYTDPNGGVIQLVYYPEANWLHKFIDQNSKITEFKREPGGRIKTVIDPVGDSIDYLYLRNQRLHKAIRHRPAIPSNPQNPASASLVTAYPNLETEFKYSPLGSLIGLKNPNRLELVFDYDENGRLCQWYHQVPNTGITLFIFDTAGQLLHRVDRKGQRIDYTFHNSGQLKSVQYPSWSDGTNTNPGNLIYFKKYDYQGRLLTVADSETSGKAEFIYDLAGNLISRRDSDGFELDLTFDDDSRLTEVKDPTGFYEVSLTLDTLGRVKSLSDSTAFDGSIQWDYKYQKVTGSSRLVLNLYQIDLAALGLTASFDYDQQNRLTTINHAWDGQPVGIYAQTVHYRDDDLITDIVGDDPNSFRYDGLKQLVFEANGNLISEYDQAGNRLYRVNTSIISNPNPSVYDQLDRLASDPALQANVTSDANGNMSSVSAALGQIKFYFDGINRLRLIRTAQHEISYLYDRDGNLSKRTVKNLSTGNSENDTFTYLISKPIIIKHNGNIASLLTWDSNGKLLRIRHQQIVGGRIYANSSFPLYDALGNIVRFVDSAKNILVQVVYDAWGNIQNLTDPVGLFEYWGFKGGVLDKLSNQILFGARWYAPIIGRWISEDPSVDLVGKTDSLFIEELSNLFHYCRNNPNNLIDTTGLKSGDVYATPDAAAIAAIKEVISSSITFNREFIGRIYGLPAGGFSYTAPIQGKMKSAPLPPPVGPAPHLYGLPLGTYDAGIYHTHGKRNPKYNDFQFSGKANDIGLALAEQIPVYLGTPFRSIAKYTPNALTVRKSDFQILEGTHSPAELACGSE